jgi:hypothetical protein
MALTNHASLPHVHQRFHKPPPPCAILKDRLLSIPTIQNVIDGSLESNPHFASHGFAPLPPACHPQTSTQFLNIERTPVSLFVPKLSFGTALPSKLCFLGVAAVQSSGTVVEAKLRRHVRSEVELRNEENPPLPSCTDCPFSPSGVFPQALSSLLKNPSAAAEDGPPACHGRRASGLQTKRWQGLTGRTPVFRVSRDGLISAHYPSISTGC